MAMVSAVQEAQKDNLRNFSEYMMTVLEDDWQKEKKGLSSQSRISTLPRTNINTGIWSHNMHKQITMDHDWHFRSPGEQDITKDMYVDVPWLFTIKLHHYGSFSSPPERSYDGGVVTYVDCLSTTTFGITQVDQMIKELGYDPKSTKYYYFRNPKGDLDNGLRPLRNDLGDRASMLKHIGDQGTKVREVDVYISHVELTENVEKTPDTPFKFSIKTKQEKVSCSKRLFD